MRVHRRFASLPAAARGAAVAIGNFDGVHRGHRAVVESAAAMAARLGARLGVVTFEPHPREVVSPGEVVPRLTGFARKALLLRGLGVEELFVLPFEREMMRLSPRAFVQSMLVERLAVRALAAGENFRFGHRRSGDVGTLAELGLEHGFAFASVAAVQDGGPVSSSRIRALLGDGEVAAAAGLLGQPHAVDGIVRQGDQRGRLLGFPTANVHPLDPRQVMPAIGVYAVRVLRCGHRDGGWLPGVANLGRRPTFDGRSVLLEVHLLQGGGDLYGERLRVAFVDRLRGERKFAGIDELRDQIGRDCRSALDRLAA
ncbi:MAG TPA: bifunctional riboflavin kinase/FAD synthetase [Geminicoccaceae bacterium]|nr:bifunctional riboflavin kinase/FAD synthetase [Geminicoccus sp.]HMU48646.1 bifunctional riboflavin kinase/FAD synthetase [Geminicoccaceae bacterium]